MTQRKLEWTKHYLSNDVFADNAGEELRVADGDVRVVETHAAGPLGVASFLQLDVDNHALPGGSRPRQIG